MAKDDPHFRLRIPDDLKQRVEKSAASNRRSINAEIIQALEQVFPPEPSVQDLLDKIHDAISMAEHANSLPYRAVLTEALDSLSERLSSGLEFEQKRYFTLPPEAVGLDKRLQRMDRWKRAQKHGVEMEDLQRELSRGLVRTVGGRSTLDAIESFREGKPQRALAVLRLDKVKFADPESAYRAIEKDLREFYTENWGNPDEPWPHED